MFIDAMQRKKITSATTDLEDLSARELYERCRAIGSLALKSRRQFIGLLPLVERRKAYLGHGLYSTYDLAGKLGGVSPDIVTEVLRLDAQLRDFPLVRKLLYRGEVGWTKIRRIAGRLTLENQEEWIEKVKNLSHQALDIYLKDFDQQTRTENISTLFENNSLLDSYPFRQLTTEDIGIESYKNEKNGKNEAENFHVEISEYNREINSSQIDDRSQTQINNVPLTKFDALVYERETFSFSLNRQIAARMRLFRQKLEKERKELITWEEVMVEFLKNIDEPKFEEKRVPGAQQTREAQQTTELANVIPTTSEPPKPATRHIPNAIKREVLARHNGLCAYQSCAKPAEILHHSKRFALTDRLPKEQAHDSSFIKPLCKPHERVIHNTLIANEDLDPSIWKLLAVPDATSPKHEIDQMVIKYRKPK